MNFNHRGFRSPTDDDPRWWFSQSGVNLFRSCPEQARALWSGEVVDVPGIQALIGTGAHKFMEHRSDPYEVRNRKVADLIVEEFQAQGGRLLPVDHFASADPAAALVTATRAGEAFSAHLPLPPVLWEVQLRADFPFGLRYPKGIHGSPDFVRDYNTGTYEVVVCDFKVSEGRKYKTPWRTEPNGKKVNQGGESWKLQRYAPQPRFYTWLVAQQLGLPIWKVGWEYLVCNPRTFKVDVLPITVDLFEMERLGREMDHIIEMASRLPGPWPLSPDDWHCSSDWCRNYHRCMGGIRPSLKGLPNAP